ncbi:sulfurtransferase complex subunit TusD [Buchnera aphidicola (Kurisakia onigurumii)]|uniref:sulfurtransferase complex subunit TusD n=1 Tax=Buchnera aphidicola TaxID=9 RepID=UPI0031B6DD03
MKFTIIVSSGIEKQGLISAYLFSYHLLKLKHKLISVFFYSEGVLNSNSMILKKEKKLDVICKWEFLSNKFHFPLHICSNAGLRKGILSNVDAGILGFQEGNLRNSFQYSGLSEWFALVSKCDRMIHF